MIVLQMLMIMIMIPLSNHHYQLYLQYELPTFWIFCSFQISNERRVEYYLLGRVKLFIRSIKDENDFFDTNTDCFDVYQ